MNLDQVVDAALHLKPGQRRAFLRQHAQLVRRPSVPGAVRISVTFHTSQGATRVLLRELPLEPSPCVEPPS